MKEVPMPIRVLMDDGSPAASAAMDAGARLFPGSRAGCPL
jgi:hypothetical protein